MASSIDAYLQAIRTAQYGRDVRDAIYNGIATCYADTTTGVNRATEVANNAASYLSTAETAAVAAKNTADMASSTLSSRISDFDAQVSSKISSYDTQISNKISELTNTISSVNARVSAADEATQNATTAANSINNLTVSYTNVGPNEQGSVIKREQDSHVDLYFKLRQGPKGDSMVVKGSAYATIAALKAAITNPSVGDMYNVGSSAPYTIYRWTGDTSVGDDGWESQGTFGSSIAPVQTSEIDTLWGGGTVTGDTEYLDRSGLDYLIDKIITALTGKVNIGASGDRLLTAAEATKLSGIAAGAEVNVQADWNQSDSTADDYIKNKPTIPAGIVVDSTWVSNSTNAVQSKVIKASIDALDAKHITITDSSALSFTLTSSSWSASTDTNYPYYTDLTFTGAGITADHYVDIVFSSSDVLSGVFSPVCQSLADSKVRIWANVNTVTSLTLLAVSAWR